VASRKSKTVEVKLPSGFKAIEHIGSFWKGREPGDTLEGVMKSRKVKHFPKNGKYKARDANVFIITTKDGRDIEVTQSGGLGALGDVKKGQKVFIGFVGMKKLAGKTAMREYIVATD
jgi:hypothetical protein